MSKKIYVTFFTPDFGVISKDGLHSGPSWPFDPHDGSGGSLSAFLKKTVRAKELEGLGFVITHYNEDDYKRICCIECDDEVPDEVLNEVVDMGFAAFGGKKITQEEAETMSKIYQPAGIEEKEVTVDQETITQKTTFGEVSLDHDGYLRRYITVELLSKDTGEPIGELETP